MQVMMLPVDKDEVINKLYVACRTCYSVFSPIDMYWDELYTTEKHTEEQKLKLIKYVMASGHTSILEVQNLTYFIEGVDRALTHQLVRHRAGIVFQQQSQRYVAFKDGKFGYVLPKAVEENSTAKLMVEELFEQISQVYSALVNEEHLEAEDARCVLPNACCTNITMTVNIRQLGHMCNERLCTTAQLPIRELFREITKQTVEQLPFLKDFLVPKCEMLGYCNEPRRTCGRKKLRSEVIK